MQINEEKICKCSPPKPVFSQEKRRHYCEICGGI